MARSSHGDVAGSPYDDLEALVDKLPAGTIESLYTVFDHPELDEAPKEGEAEEEELEWQDAFPTLDTMVIWEPEVQSRPTVRPRSKRVRRRRNMMLWNLPIMAPAAEDSPSPRRCQHCAAKNTPQWRAGRTLCNACGIRYRSGRLMPEYRPMKSPTFSPELHSNSHRCVMEMRRLKDSGDAKPPPPPSEVAGPRAPSRP